MRIESIGPTHPDYVAGFGDWTQIRIWDKDRLLAHFFGPVAKMNARLFCLLRRGDTC